MSEYMSVVLREYSHYALSKVSMLPFPSEVESALADYFPASFLGSALIGDKLGALFGLSRPFIRNLDNDLKYAAVINQPDQRGEVWGGALWTCRQEPGVGTSVVDRAAFDAWRLAGQAPSNPELAKQFGAGLGARDGQVGQCLAQEIAKRGIPH